MKALRVERDRHEGGGDGEDGAGGEGQDKAHEGSFTLAYTCRNTSVGGVRYLFSLATPTR